MTEIELPKDFCPLCNLKKVSSEFTKDYENACIYYHPNCGSFGLTYNAYRYTPIINDKEIRAKLSYYLVHNSELPNSRIFYYSI